MFLKANLTYVQSKEITFKLSKYTTEKNNFI